MSTNDSFQIDSAFTTRDCLLFEYVCFTDCLSICSAPALITPQARSSGVTGKSTSSLGLADFELLRVIGRGSYAKVLLVQLKKTERIYAMKVVKKELVNDDEVLTPDLPLKFFLLFVQDDTN